MTSPLVSVCMPASRPSVMFDEALSSVLAQSLDDFEVIVTDDSGGSLRPTVERIGDDRIRYHPNRSPLGFSGNHCRALDLARGRHVAILHDDDAWSPTYLEVAAGILEREHDVGICISCAVDVSSDGRLLRRKPTAMMHGVQRDALAHLLDGRFPIMYPSSAMWRRRALTANARPWPDLVVADVTAFIDPIIAGWQLYYNDEPLVRYRVHDGQIGARDQFRHRDGQVKVWSGYAFVHKRHERQRRRLLATWQIARAGSHLESGRIHQARYDLASAARADTSVQPLRRLALRTLCAAPGLIRPSRRALDAARRVADQVRKSAGLRTMADASRRIAASSGLIVTLANSRYTAK